MPLILVKNYPVLYTVAEKYIPNKKTTIAQTKMTNTAPTKLLRKEFEGILSTLPLLSAGDI
jgi:hypothetical protein